MPAPDAAARRARVATVAVFTLNGALFGSWAARVPAVRDLVGAGDGELGLVLACIAAGAIVSMPLAGALANRVGSRRAMRGALVLDCFAFGVIALAPTVWSLALLALLLGLSNGALDVSMNAHGVAVERRFGRPILSGLHAGFSAGGLLGSGLGALVAAAGIDVRVHLALTAALALVIGGLWSRRALPAAEDRAAPSTPVLVRPPARLVPLGALAFGCLLIEGAAADWSAVYLRDELAAGAGVAALGFTAFSVTMTAGRLAGDGLVQRGGPVALVRAGAALATCGFAAALLLGTPAAALAGLACLGAGLASIVPIVFRAAAAAAGDGPPGVSVAAVSSVGYLGFMAGPPLIGGLAETTGLPGALWLVVVIAAVVAMLAPVAAPRPAAAR